MTMPESVRQTIEDELSSTRFSLVLESQAYGIMPDAIRERIARLDTALAWLTAQQQPERLASGQGATVAGPDANGLLPCPHCGEHEYVELQPTHNGMMRVYCDNCGCCGYETDDREQAIDAWNRRPTPATDSA
jgi:Lar family restriction alleviation protein